MSIMNASSRAIGHVPLNTDSEIRWITDDTLGRAPFARRVAERIVAAAGEPSVVFGLAGPWGAGKTSLINMVDQVLEQEHPDQWSVVRFTPWSTSTVDSLTDEFYQSIAAAMPSSDTGRKARQQLLAMAPAVTGAVMKAGLRAIVDRYVGQGAAEEITSAATDAVSDSLGKLEIEPDPFIERFKKAAKAIEDAGLNVLVVVDDVDRLHAEELLTVLKAVRLLGRFDRVHYLLAYDEETLLDVLQASDIAHADRRRASAYLEKIIQYPYMLPPLQQAHIESALRGSLTRIAQIHKVRLSEDLSAWTHPVEIAIDRIPEIFRRRFTLRTVNRLASQTDVLLSVVDAGEIDFIDAVLITYLRLHHRPIYDQLPSWQADLVTSPAPAVIYLEDRSEKVDWPQRVSTVLGQNADPDEVKALMGVLTELYPRVGLRISAHTLKSCPASSPDYFARYFAFAIPVGDVADAVIRGEMGYLCERGELPAMSVIADMIRHTQLHGLLSRKVDQCRDVVDNATSGQAAQAAHYLTEQNRRNTAAHQPTPGCARILNLLAERAILAAPSPQEAATFVDIYTEKCGIRYAATVFTETRLDVYSQAERAGLDQITAACTGLRDQITAACITDLSTVVDPADPRNVTILRMAGFLSVGQWDALASAAKQLIANGAKPWELAGRFVGAAPMLETPYTLRREYLVRVVPAADWQLDTIVDFDPPASTHNRNQTLTAEEALAARIAYAATVMKKTADEPETSGVAQTSLPSTAPDESSTTE
ncbi:KAP family P-loop domain protein [Mycobacteroides abscessus subsp. bolletii]|nr:KAP family P-loop domain protein [Mycobacteroides abscessus subsp. bolletii]